MDSNSPYTNRCLCQESPTPYFFYLIPRFSIHTNTNTNTNKVNP